MLGVAVCAVAGCAPAALLPAFAQATTALVITRAAGTGSAGAATPGPATASALGTADGVAFDAGGDLYVADAGDNRVYEVTPGGTLSIVAGTGSAGAPVPGAATGSPLNGPSAVAVDAAGDVYIADTGNHEVEKVTPGGRLSILAGTGSAGAPTPGTATNSKLGGPSGLAIDPAGDLIIADGGGSAGNPYVEEVSPAGVLSILAGSGARGAPTAGTATSSKLDDPTGVAVDPGGDVYVADAGDNIVVKVASGRLSVVAGQLSGLAGAPTAGTATSSKLDGPTGVAVDAAGDVDIADRVNERIEQVTPAGQLSVLAGTGSARAPSYGAAPASSPLDGPFSLAVSPAGVIDVADAASASVDQIAPPAPVDAAAPVITGTDAAGQTLTAAPGSWTNGPTGYAYQWQDCDPTGAGCTAIAGATAAAYALGAGDAGDTVRVVVTASDPGGAASAESAPTAVVLPPAPTATTAPAITGTATDLQTLTATPGAWTFDPSAYAYQWQDCDDSGATCANIGGATQDAYTLGYGDVGETIRVIVTATDAGGSASATSAASAVVAPVLTPWANTTPPAATVAPFLLGAAAVGDTLHCAPGVWSGGPAGLAVQWDRNNMPIAGATGQAYTVRAADRGLILSCRVTAANAGGTVQAVSGGVIVPGAPAPAAAPLARQATASGGATRRTRTRRSRAHRTRARRARARRGTPHRRARSRRR